MTATIELFLTLLEQMGSDVIYHRESGGSVCPCLSPEGFRSPAWHKANPAAPVCNENGLIDPAIIEFPLKASIQPVRASRRRVGERAIELFGEVEVDDHLGIFPCEWNGLPVEFFEWPDSGSDYILYDDRRFIAVAYDKIADVDGDPNHHWEVGLRAVSEGRIVF